MQNTNAKVRELLNTGKKQQYKAPAVIYEGTITTRAGSPAGKGENAVDPADLFGND